MTNNNTAFLLKIEVEPSVFEKPALEFRGIVDQAILDAIPEFREYVLNKYYEMQKERNDNKQ